MKSPLNIRNILAGAAAVGLLACASPKTATFGTAENLLGYGVYTAQGGDANGYAVKLMLNSNHTYVKKKFQGPCLLVENKGDWKSTNEVIEFRLQEIRSREDCGSEQWKVEKADKSAERMIRNVTTTSFEMLDQEEQTSAEWQKFTKK